MWIDSAGMVLQRTRATPFPNTITVNSPATEKHSSDDQD